MGHDFGPMFFGMGRGGRGGRGSRGGRMFDQGDLKFVILQLLEAKPRHGYEIIKELEERSGGRYTPSPGTVYPTLTMLEDMGYATIEAEAGGKKVYSITDEGRAYLTENKQTADDVFERLSELGASIFGDGIRPAHEAMGSLGRAYWRATMRQPASGETISKVIDILKRAAGEIEELATTR
ncbi:MAG: PadR family transcriptional regulator [Gemmatimonadetes bacterium]|nr:PadR family transcriptional regulator [Gemmatimonadota bacterium]